MSISVNEIRKDFPLLENRKVIYLDTAATSQSHHVSFRQNQHFMKNIMPIPCEDYTSWERRQPKNTKKPERRSGDLSMQKKQRRSSLSAMPRKA